MKAAEVQTITPHDLRHTCASLAISAGVNVLPCRGCWDTSAKITLDTYAGLFDADLDAVAAALDTKCAQSVPKPVPSPREAKQAMSCEKTATFRCGRRDSNPQALASTGT